MTEIFIKIVNMSISASWIVLAVLLFRFILKKAPKWVMVLLWGIVALRLICPISVESVVSLIPSAETINPKILIEASDEINSGIPAVDNIINPVINESHITIGVEKSVGAVNMLTKVFSRLWIAGIAIMIGYAVITYYRLQKKIGTAVILRNNIYQSENVESPFVLGLINPKIYLPFNMSKSDMQNVIAHEQAHINRRDYLWKPLGFLLLTVYWFNPFMWLAYIMLCRDIELACDEKVVKELGSEQRADYSQALLNCSVNRLTIAACPIAFGEVGVKERVKSVLNYKKPAFWIIAVSVILCTVAAVCFLTNPVNTKIDEETEAYLRAVILEQGRTEHTEPYYPCEDHIILKAESDGAVTTVYALVRYGEYSFVNGEIEEKAGFHMPAIITLDMEGAGYSSSCWWPGDGSEYAPSIREHFPLFLRSKAINIHRYSKEQSERCMAQAKEYFMMSDIAEMNIGAEMPSIVYGDGARFILSGTFGLLEYNTDEAKSSYLLPHSSLDKPGMESLRQFTASADGKTVYIGGFDGANVNWRYMLDTSDFTLSEYSGEIPQNVFVCSSIFDGYYDYIDAATQGRYLIGDTVLDINGCLWYVRADKNWRMSSLQLVCLDKSSAQEKAYDALYETYNVFFGAEPVVPEIDSFTDTNNPVGLIQGCTINDLVEAWGEPEAEYDTPHSALWPIDNTNRVLSVYFEGNGVVAAAYVLSAEEMINNGDDTIALIEMINTLRRDNGLSTLTAVRASENSGFYEASRIRFEEIKQEFSHNRPNGESYITAFDAVSGSGFAEVLGAGQSTAVQVFNEWANNPHTKEVLMSKDVTHMCVFVGKIDDGMLYWLLTACSLSDDTNLAYGAAYSWVNYSAEGYKAMTELAENKDTERRYGNVEHLMPLVKLETKAEFDKFYKTMAAYFDFEGSYDESEPFSRQAKRYTKDFFTENTLFIAYIDEPTSSNRHEIEEIRIENGILEIRISRIEPQAYDCAMAGWFMVVDVPKEITADCVEFDAYICAKIYPDNVFPSGSLIRRYIHDSGDIFSSASVSLYDNGQFEFVFSPLSSYIAFGTYTEKDNRLILNTEDELYTYVFDVSDDMLIFDAEASSDVLWQSGLTDGSVFR